MSAVRGLHADAGVVDQDVETAEAVEHLLTPASIWSRSLTSSANVLVRAAGAAVEIAVAVDDARAVGAERIGDRAADALRRAGHQRDLVLEVDLHVSP